jgi:hypothetical protein
MMLEKLKTLHSTDYRFGEGQIESGEWERIEAEIRGRYSETEFIALRNLGFSLLNAEERARQTGNTEYYNATYRLYSKHIHGTDLNEQLQDVLTPESVPKYVMSRILCLLQATFNCSLNIINKCNDRLGNPIKMPV